MKYWLMILWILFFWPSDNEGREIYTGFGIGIGPAFPVINQTKWVDDRRDDEFTFFNRVHTNSFTDGGRTSFNLLRAQMGPVLTSEFFVGYGPVAFSLHGSVFFLPQRNVPNMREYRILDSGGWLNAFLIAVRYNIPKKNAPFSPYLNFGLGGVHFRPRDSQQVLPKLHFGGVIGLGSEFATKREVSFFSEIRFQFARFRGRREDVPDKITGTLDVVVGCRLWIASE